MGAHRKAREEIVSPARAFRTALIATASNPLTIASWAAIFAAASTARIAHTTPAAVALLTAIGCRSFAWFAVLSGAIAMVRDRVSHRGLRIADTVSGFGIMGFGCLLGWRAFRNTRSVAGRHISSPAVQPPERPGRCIPVTVTTRPSACRPEEVHDVHDAR